MELRKSAEISSTKANQRRFKPCSSQVCLQSGPEESNNNYSYKTENLSDCGIKYLSHYREDDDSRLLVGKDQIKPSGVTRAVKNMSFDLKDPLLVVLFSETNNIRFVKQIFVRVTCGVSLSCWNSN